MLPGAVVGRRQVGATPYEIRSQGATEEEALKNIGDAIREYLQAVQQAETCSNTPRGLAIA